MTTGFTVIDLSQLPPPQVVEPLDYETILAEMIADLQARHSDFDALLESDPAFKVLEVAAYREILLRAKINDSAKAVMLPYAVDDDLENLGSYWNVERLEVTPEDDSTIPPTPAVMEANEPFRRRIQLAMEGQTNAGTKGAYIYQTLSADGEVKDADAKSPSEGEVLVTVLSLSGGGSPSDELMEAVVDHLSQPHVRQLTDQLSIQKAGIISYRVDADIYVQPGPGSDQVMNAAREAAQKFVDERHRLGIIIPVSGIYGALQQPGVSRVVLNSPSADITPGDTEAGFCTAIELTQHQEGS